jgi:hypothetical protein
LPKFAMPQLSCNGPLFVFRFKTSPKFNIIVGGLPVPVIFAAAYVTLPPPPLPLAICVSVTLIVHDVRGCSVAQLFVCAIPPDVCTLVIVTGIGVTFQSVYGSAALVVPISVGGK